MKLELLYLFLLLKIGQEIIESYLAKLNLNYYIDQPRQREAQKILNISEEDMAKTVSYSVNKYKFGQFSSWAELIITLAFIAWGGLGLFEKWTYQLTHSYTESKIIVGLVLFGLLGICSGIISLPFDYYHTFVLEQKHGFNRQTLKGFITDRLKGIILISILGGLLLSVILYIMEKMATNWWLWAWLTISGFSIFTAWIFPTLLAPLFNKFSPIPEGELKEQILKLAQKINFKTDGLFVMDASRRTSHGNAYFTGLFSKKRIVLFDTLVESMKNNEIVAVLAHELGHFKLHHVRWGLIRGVVTTGMMLYLLSLCLPLEPFYKAFALEGVSNYGALIVFSLWFGPVSFLIQPLESYLSRRNEFAADRFALLHVDNKKDLGNALLKLREKSQAMPISHPLFSKVYHSHPPMLERLKAMEYI